MTVNDKIRDEKLQYNINREVAKISPLASGKIGKHEYLTGEQILPSDQRRVLEEAAFPYSLLGKSWEKQRTTTEDQGQKQVQGIEDFENKSVKSNTFFEKEKCIQLDRQKEIFYNLVAENGTGEMEKLHNSVNFQNLMFHFKSPTKILIFMISLMLKLFSII